ncbi:hypothetical protein ACWD48_22795 [Streptomyces sp. NPDC002519]
MLAEAFTALAAAGGTAVVQAAGTSTWTGFQHAVARWFGHGDEERERVELERLDRSADALMAAAGGSEADTVAIRQQAAWQAHFERALEGLSQCEQERAAEELRALLDAQVAPGTVSAGDRGQAIGGDVDIRADHGSVAALRVGDVTLGTPPTPGPTQG